MKRGEAFNSIAMKVTKFLNIDIEPAPPELELEIEMQCRELMKSIKLINYLCLILPITSLTNTKKLF